MKKIIGSILVTLGLVAGSAQAQWTPGKEIVKVIVPFAPGGGADIGMRHFQKYAENRGIKLVAVYKGGAEGQVGSEDLAKSIGDGLTISYTTIATAAAYELANPNYQFRVVSMVKAGVMALTSNPNNGIKDFKQFEQELRKKDSRKTFALGAPGHKILIDQMFKFTGATNPIPVIAYKGSVPAINDVIGGHVDFMICPLQLVKQHVDSGSLRLLAISLRGIPSKDISNVPVIDQAWPEWRTDDGFVITMSANTPPEAFAFWSNLVKQYVADKNTQADWQREYMEGVPFGEKFGRERIVSAMQSIKKGK